MKSKYESQMKKGMLDMLVLTLLAQKEKYGYQIITELKERSGGRFLLKEGTLYPILYRLEDDGMISSRWKEAGEKHIPRKYYRITENGQRALREITDLWKDLNEAASRIMEGEEDE